MLSTLERSSGNASTAAPGTFRRMSSQAAAACETTGRLLRRRRFKVQAGNGKSWFAACRQAGAFVVATNEQLTSRLPHRSPRMSAVLGEGRRAFVAGGQRCCDRFSCTGFIQTFWSFLQASTTCAPLCANAVAVALPMPALAPVTTHTRPDMVLLVGKGCLPTPNAQRTRCRIWHRRANF